MRRRAAHPAKVGAEQICAIIAIACEPPSASDRPITQWSQQEVADEAMRRGIVVVQPNVLQSGSGPVSLPDMVETAAAETPVTIMTWKHPGTVLASWQRLEKLHRRRGQLDRAGAGLSVAQTKKLKHISGLIRITHSTACILP